MHNSKGRRVSHLRACVRACVRVCVCVCVRAFARARVRGQGGVWPECSLRAVAAGGRTCGCAHALLLRVAAGLQAHLAHWGTLEMPAAAGLAQP